ncbi:MAG: heme ABC exporter ATP-binding protein CcmA [Bacillota bacterium]
MIEARKITKRFGTKTILHGINLHIHAGEFVTLLGPNGAGKTTLLKILSMMASPTSGELRVNGRTVGEDHIAIRREIGVISHNTFLYDHLNAAENLRFYGGLYEVPNLTRRIEEVIEEVGLQYALKDPVRTFSRGMQQRLSIARAIIHDPRILFLDEPYTGLDQHAIEILNRVLRKLASSQRTIFLITHNFQQGLEMSDRVLILAKGQLVYEEKTGNLQDADFKEIYLRHVEVRG